MNPYAERITMPDGTTRAPLIERDERLRPRKKINPEREDSDFYTLAICRHGWWAWTCEGECWLCPIHEGLPLFRMAAMDWLDKQGVDGKLALLAALSCDDGSSVDERIARHAHLRLDAEEVK